MKDSVTVTQPSGLHEIINPAHTLSKDPLRKQRVMRWKRVMGVNVDMNGDGATDRDGDLGIVHMLDSKRWMTAKEVQVECRQYNNEYGVNAFSTGLAYVTASLVKCVEYGIAVIGWDELTQGEEE